MSPESLWLAESLIQRASFTTADNIITLNGPIDEAAAEEKVRFKSFCVSTERDAQTGFQHFGHSPGKLFALLEKKQNGHPVVVQLIHTRAIHGTNKDQLQVETKTRELCSHKVDKGTEEVLLTF